MGAVFYKVARAGFSFSKLPCIREFVTGRERADRPGPFIIACSHLSHLEPAFVGTLVQRPIRWMARIEFYSRWWGAAFLNWGGAFSVDRFGHSAPAVRRAISLLQSGEVVGIFPEGGVALGRESVLRCGPIKGGVCTISIATGAPVVPVVVLGTERLNRVRPWLPTKSGRVWIAFGEDVQPSRTTRGTSRRGLRLEMAGRVRRAFVQTYQHLLSEARLRDDEVP